MIRKKILTLEGRIISPVITPKPFYKKYGCWINITSDLSTNRRARRRYVGLVTKGERKAPRMLNAYRGFVKVTFVSQSEEQVKKQLRRFLTIDNLGNNSNSGYGKVNWLQWRVEEFHKEEAKPQRKKLRIRKGLGPNYPKELQRLLIALMLHDFVHTEKHTSKIYQEINIEDEEIREACHKHHNQEENGNSLTNIVKYFDRVAAYISRQIPFRTEARYDFKNGRIDFEKLVNDIEEQQHSAYKLYNYIYRSKELDRIVESMVFSNKSIRNHLLLMVNLAINSYYNKWMKIVKGKLILEKKASPSATNKEEPHNAKDAEMHLTLSMNEKRSLGNLVQVNEERKVISKEKSTRKVSMERTPNYASSSSPANK
ncbi:MAG: hypothetical protein ACTSQB_07460 [Candidatus Heimdallarchaeota archaeon]